MIIKSREEPLELKILRLLNSRMDLSAKEKYHYHNLEKGYKGELIFDEWITPISNDALILNDLLFEINNTVCQIDSLVIKSKSIYLFEVKNYEGDYFIEDDRWYSLPKSEIKDPLLQLKRTESLIRRWCQDIGSKASIESSLVFVNPDFHLYQAPLQLPIIFPSQLNRFINNEKKKPSKITANHQQLANQLLSLHLNELPYNRLPLYNIDQLKKGILCPYCRTLNNENKNTLVCINCGFRDNFEKAVLRSVEEFKLLFPSKKITTKNICDWCDCPHSIKTVWRILSGNFKQSGHGRSSYYE